MITNCMVLTEGWDYPPVSCVILLRRCSSKSPMIQMVGRGLRIVNQKEYPGIVKKDCVILDFGRSLLTHDDLYAGLRLDDGFKKCPAKESEAKAKGYRFPDSNGNTGCGKRVPVDAKECPHCGFLFEALKSGKAEKDEEEEEPLAHVDMTIKDVLNGSPFRYVDIFRSGRVLMASGFEAWAGIMSADGENWYALGKRKNTYQIETIVIGKRLQAVSAADDFLRKYETSEAVKKSKRWLDDPASEKQIASLNSLGYGLVPDLLGNCGMSKYAAMCHLNFQWARRGIEQALGVQA